MESRIGVTGTRFGMTEAQKGTLRALLRRNAISHWHHGRCVGVDIETHEEVTNVLPETRIVVHPPIKTEHEGDPERYAGHEQRPRKGHFARNRDIVDDTDGLVVIPYQDSWQPEGGTWYTHDYAVKRGKPIVIIWPDGNVHNSCVEGYLVHVHSTKS